MSPLSPSLPLHWVTEVDKGNTLYPYILYHGYEQEGGGGTRGIKGTVSPLSPSVILHRGTEGDKGTPFTLLSSIMIMSRNGGGTVGIRRIMGIKGMVSPLSPSVSLYWGTEGENWSFFRVFSSWEDSGIVM